MKFLKKIYFNVANPARKWDFMNTLIFGEIFFRVNLGYVAYDYNIKQCLDIMSLQQNFSYVGEII